MDPAGPAASAIADVLERQCDLYCHPQNSIMLSWQVARLAPSSAQLKQQKDQCGTASMT